MPPAETAELRGTDRFVIRRQGGETCIGHPRASLTGQPDTYTATVPEPGHSPGDISLAPTRCIKPAAGFRAARLIKSWRRVADASTDDDLDGDLIEPYHDRMRESVLAHLVPDVFAARSGHLAHALLRAGAAAASPEAVVRHLLAEEVPRSFQLALQATALGLMLVDNVREADFQARALDLALDAGEPRRLLCALVFEAIYRAQESPDRRRQAEVLLDTARRIASDRLDPRLDGYIVLGDSFLAYYHGHHHDAVIRFQDAADRFRLLPAAAWEKNTIRLHILRATDYQGARGELRPLYNEYIRDARTRNDRYIEASPSSQSEPLVKRPLASPRPARSRGRRSRAQRVEPARARSVPPATLFRAARPRRAGPVPQRRRVQGVWARPGLDAAGLLRSAAKTHRGDTSAAVAGLTATDVLADNNDFPLCATIARLRIGQLLGRKGAEKLAEAERWMREQDVHNPRRMAFAAGYPLGS